MEEGKMGREEFEKVVSEVLPHMKAISEILLSRGIPEDRLCNMSVAAGGFMGMSIGIRVSPTMYQFTEGHKVQIWDI